MRWPDHIDPQHPLITKQYAVYTPPIDSMIGQISDWIDQQIPGGYIYGASRLGKTRGVKWFLTMELEARYEHIVPLIIWIRRPDTQLSEAGFWQQLLVASGFAFANPLKQLKRNVGFDQCHQRFMAIAKNSGRNYIALLIDEAQDLTLREWKWLTGLQNVLDDSGFLLSVFSVGTHQLGYQHEYLASTGNAHVAARFMTAHMRFHGLRTADELKYVLNAYDQDSEWPPSSGRTFVEYCAAVDYGMNRRLADSTGVLWEALGALTPPKAQRLREYPMQSVARSVEAALLRVARGESWETVMSYKSWLNELVKANFPDHMRVIATAG